MTCDPLVLPLNAHTDADVASIVSVTASPDVAVAVTVYAGSPNFALAGAVDVKLTVCAPLPTANDCCAHSEARGAELPNVAGQRIEQASESGRPKGS